MAKRYICTKCKEKFRNPIKLTRHVKACKAGRLPRKEGKCPDCGETFRTKGLGSHRKAKHGVDGTSRWSVSAKKKKNGTFTPRIPRIPDLDAPEPTVVTAAAEDPNREIIRKLNEKADQHRAISADHLKKAEEITRMASTLIDLLAN